MAISAFESLLYCYIPVRRNLHWSLTREGLCSRTPKEGKDTVPQTFVTGSCAPKVFIRSNRMHCLLADRCACDCDDTTLTAMLWHRRGWSGRRTCWEIRLNGVDHIVGRCRTVGRVAIAEARNTAKWIVSRQTVITSFTPTTSQPTLLIIIIIIIYLYNEAATQPLSRYSVAWINNEQTRMSQDIAG